MQYSAINVKQVNNVRKALLLRLVLEFVTDYLSNYPSIYAHTHTKTHTHILYIHMSIGIE